MNVHLNTTDVATYERANMKCYQSVYIRVKIKQPLTVQHHNDSEDDYRSGCRNVSHCHQLFFSELHSPGRSH